MLPVPPAARASPKRAKPPKGAAIAGEGSGEKSRHSARRQRIALVLELDVVTGTDERLQQPNNCLRRVARGWIRGIAWPNPACGGLAFKGSPTRPQRDGSLRTDPAQCKQQPPAGGRTSTLAHSRFEAAACSASLLPGLCIGSCACPQRTKRRQRDEPVRTDRHRPPPLPSIHCTRCNGDP